MPLKIYRENFIPKWYKVVILKNNEKIGDNQEFPYHFVEKILTYERESSSSATSRTTSKTGLRKKNIPCPFCGGYQDLPEV